jgi:hypothetical protein
MGKKHGEENRLFEHNGDSVGGRVPIYLVNARKNPRTDFQANQRDEGRRIVREVCEKLQATNDFFGVSDVLEEIQSKKIIARGSKKPMGIWAVQRYMRVLELDGELKRIGRKYTLDPEKFDLWMLSYLEKAMREVRRRKVEGMITVGGPGKDPAWVYYEMCEGERNRYPAWKGLVPIKVGKKGRLVNMSGFMITTFLRSVNRRKIRWNDLPDKVLVALVISPKELKKWLKMQPIAY